jgi:hypothetical protein
MACGMARLGILRRMHVLACVLIGWNWAFILDGKERLRLAVCSTGVLQHVFLHVFWLAGATVCWPLVFGWVLFGHMLLGTGSFDGIGLSS